MKHSSVPISEDDLHAYADGQLDDVRRAEVASWLAAHPEQQARVAAWREQSAQLHRAYDALLEQPVPPRLQAPADAPRRIDRRRVAAIGWVMLGMLAGFLLRDLPPGDPVPALAGASLPRLAAVAHAVYTPELRHPVEVGADQEAHLVGWLSKRLGAELKPPRLDAAGYQLIGGRLLPGDAGEVAQFMYEDAAGNRLTLYVQPAAAQARDAGFRHAREGDIDVFYWIDGQFGYALSGTTGRNDMLMLATLVYRQLSPMDPPTPNPLPGAHQ
jgi:anti-sigma factor RsiW